MFILLLVLGNQLHLSLFLSKDRYKETTQGVQHTQQGQSLPQLLHVQV